MSHPHGTYLGGIRNLDDLRLRCVVDEDTGCWHWRLSKCDGVPKVHVTHPALPRPGHIMRGRRAALLLARGRDLPAGHVAYARLTCQSADCVNPSHCQSGDRHAHGRQFGHAVAGHDVGPRGHEPQREHQRHVADAQLGNGEPPAWRRAARRHRRHRCSRSHASITSPTAASDSAEQAAGTSAVVCHAG